MTETQTWYTCGCCQREFPKPIDVEPIFCKLCVVTILEVPDDVMEWAEAVFANVDPLPSNPKAPDNPYEPIDKNYTKPDVIGIT